MLSASRIAFFTFKQLAHSNDCFPSRKLNVCGVVAAAHEVAARSLIASVGSCGLQSCSANEEQRGLSA
jgi:hypothetical protein